MRWGRCKEELHLDVSVVPVVHREERGEARADELAVGMISVQAQGPVSRQHFPTARPPPRLVGGRLTAFPRLVHDWRHAQRRSAPIPRCVHRVEIAHIPLLEMACLPASLSLPALRQGHVEMLAEQDPSQLCVRVERMGWRCRQRLVDARDVRLGKEKGEKLKDHDSRVRLQQASVGHGDRRHR